MFCICQRHGCQHPPSYLCQEYLGYKHTHHVRIVLVYTHVCERVKTGHSSESQMTVQLREGVVRVLAGLHLGQGLRRSGSGCCGTPSSLGRALHQMDGVARLNLIV